MSRGLAKFVKIKYGGTEHLQTYPKPQLGGIGVMSGGGRIIINLITKERNFEKPDMKWIDFTLSILVAYCEHMAITKIVMPWRLACGLDGLNWDVVFDKIMHYFDETSITVLICKVPLS